MSRKINRREFIRNSSALGAGFCAFPLVTTLSRSPNAKLNVACIGSGGRGAASVNACGGENIVALCDIDPGRAGGSFKKFPNAKRYSDFRKMLDEMAGQIDAVTVGIPDNTHAAAAVMAMRLGKHVYCEKPLTHDVYEARLMRELAAEKKVATQMGNQGTSNSTLRGSVEIIQAGGIGTVKEIHVWTNRPVWPQSPKITARPKDTPAVPGNLNWDAWIGPAPMRPYHPCYHPFKWRGWWDFGTGALGDMACHTANMPYMGAQLTAPTSIEAENERLNPETFPGWARIKYAFPARGSAPALTLWWYEGKRDGKLVWPPQELFHGEKISNSGALVVGSKGTLYSSNDYGGNRKLLPKKNFEGYQPPPETLPRSPGHHNEWIQACKGGPKAMSNFDYAGPLTEFILLGNVAMKVGKKILWDAKACKVTNAPEAASLIKREYRKGWKL